MSIIMYSEMDENAQTVIEIRLCMLTDARRCAHKVNQNLISPIDSCALFARGDLPQFQTSYQQVARLRGRPVALGGSLKHRFGRWKTLVSARRANKVVPVRTKCRYIFYTRYRQHLQPAIELSFALFSPLFVSCAVHTDLLLFSLFLFLFESFSRDVCFANCWYVARKREREFFVVLKYSLTHYLISLTDKYRTLLLSYTRKKNVQ